jgi:hypothetical protein
MTASRLLGSLLVAVLVTACAPVDDSARAEAVVRDWLSALTGGDEDRGYAYLHPTLRTARMRDDYVEATDHVDAAALEWEVISGSDHEGGHDVVFHVVDVRVEGGSPTLPAGLFGLMLVQPWMVDRDDMGIVVVVRSDAAGTGIWTPGG